MEDKAKREKKRSGGLGGGGGGRGGVVSCCIVIASFESLVLGYCWLRESSRPFSLVASVGHLPGFSSCLFLLSRQHGSR